MEKDYIEMIIKMENEFKLTVVHFTRPNPMQICACAWIYRWTKKNWKTRTTPSDLRVARPPCQTARPPGGVPWAVGRGPWAVGRWVAVLLLAKPSVPLLLPLFVCIFFSQLKSFCDCYWCLYSRIKETLRCIINAFTRFVKHSKDALLIPLLLVKVKMRLR